MTSDAMRDPSGGPIDTADQIALFVAAMQTGRLLAGGVTHELNSALQRLGDALFAIRDDARGLLERTAAAPTAADGIESSLTRAESDLRVKAP